MTWPAKKGGRYCTLLSKFLGVTKHRALLNYAGYFAPFYLVLVMDENIGRNDNEGSFGSSKISSDFAFDVCTYLIN